MESEAATRIVGIEPQEGCLHLVNHLCSQLDNPSCEEARIVTVVIAPNILNPILGTDVHMVQLTVLFSAHVDPGAPMYSVQLTQEPDM